MEETWGFWSEDVWSCLWVSWRIFIENRWFEESQLEFFDGSEGEQYFLRPARRDGCQVGVA